MPSRSTLSLVAFGMVLPFAGCAAGDAEDATIGAHPPGTTDTGTGTTPPKRDTGTASLPDSGASPDTTGTSDAGDDTDPNNEGGVTSLLADSAAPPEDAPKVSGGKRIFVSSSGYTGNLGGLAGADAKCANLAASAGLVGTFKAWLSDAATSAASRLTHSTGPYTLIDGTLVAKDWVQLTSASATSPLLHAVDMTETGGKPVIWDGAKCNSNPAYRPAWTGTKPDGSSEPFYNCDGWTTTTGNLMWGAAFTVATSNAWTQSCYYPKMCFWKAAIYCIEQ